MNQLLVFTRFPHPGRVKTRLIPALGPDGASRLHEALTRRTLSTARSFATATNGFTTIYIADGDVQEMQSLFGDDLAYAQQTGADLGERLTNAVHHAFATGKNRVLTIGTDCPELSAEILTAADAALQHADVVLGPALDGGYYLIALRAAHPQLFQNIDWGTDRVLEQTQRIAQSLKLTVHELPPLSDIDEPQDLLVWRRVVGDLPGPPTHRAPRFLSVIIPTLNEAERISLALEPILKTPNVEAIVADGGSHDDTVDIAQRLGARTVVTPPGRARQMNAGAAIASGGRLLFLHADTRLPTDFAQQIDAVLGANAAAGAFRLQIDSPRPAFRWIERGANLRSRLLGLPYGDQALFLNADAFYRLGGFAPFPLMEDFELCRQLRRLGRIQLADAAVVTSPRRWKHLGIIRTTLTNQLCVAGYLLGVSPHRLHHWYCRAKRP